MRLNQWIRQRMRTRETSTLIEYNSITERLKRHVAKEGLTPSPENVIQHIENLIPDRSYSWLRKVKASLIHHYSENHIEHAVARLENITPENCKRKDLQTSANKKKTIKAAHLLKLRDFLKSHAIEMKNTKPLHAIIEATLIAGLRPTEWTTAKITQDMTEISALTRGVLDYDGGFPALIVKNAKATNGRSFGTFRGLDLSGIDGKGLIFIKLAIAYCSGEDDPDFSWKDRYNTLRVSLYNMIRFHLPSLKGVSLYTFRHQCIANLKQKYTPVEVALIVGHLNDTTASEHYARKRYGTDTNNLVKANYADTPKIQQLLDTKLSKREFHNKELSSRQQS